MDIIGTAAQCVAILGGAGYAGRKILNAAASVRDATAATRQLTGEFQLHRADVVKTLTEHGERLARLEGASK